MRPGPTELLILSAITLTVFIPAWRIVSKAGWPGWLSLGLAVPGLNLILLFVFAFAKWPLERELAERIGRR